MVRSQLFCSLNALAILLLLLLPLLLLPFSSVLRFGQLTSNKSRNNHFGIDFQQQEGHVIFSRHACVRACMPTRERASDRAHHAVNGYCCKAEKFAIISLKLTITARSSHSKVDSFEAFPLANCVFVISIQTHFNVFVQISYQKWHQERLSNIIAKEALI